MASPFELFRKNQKIWMAVIGLLCIVAFVLGDTLLSYQSTGAGGEDRAMVETVYGRLRGSEMDVLRKQRSTVASFLALNYGVMFGENPDPRAVMALRMEQQRLQAQYATDDRSVLEKFLLVKRAEEQGVVVSDTAVLDFIKGATNNMVDNAEMAEILRTMQVSKAELFNAIRSELMSQEATRLYVSSFRATPAQRWDYYKRNKLRVSADLLPVPVDQFIDKVEEPSVGVLNEFFEKYKNEEPVAGSPEPGFKIPAKGKFDYLVADFDQFAATVVVSAEEIKAYYDVNKEPQFRYSGNRFSGLNLGGHGATEPPADPKAVEADPAKETPAAGDAAPATDSSAADDAETPADGEPAVSETPADGETPAEPSAEEAPAEETPAADPAVETPATDETPAADEAGPAPGAEMAFHLSGVLTAALFQDEASATDEADATSADAAAPVTETPATETPAAESPKTETPDATIPLGTPLGDAPVRRTFPPIGDDLMLNTDVTAGEDPKYDPLWKVEETIRKQLTADKTEALIRAAIDKAEESVRKYSTSLAVWEVKKDVDSALERPAAIDLKQIAAQTGLKAESTPLVSALEARQLPGLGEATVQNRPFSQAAFDNLTTYLSSVAIDLEGNQYLFWKTEGTEARVPEFSEVADEVERAWRMIQARELAIEEAKSIAERVRGSDKSLVASFIDDKEVSAKIIKAGPFSWLTGGSAGFSGGAPPALSEIDGVQDIGNDFMRAVFDLEVGEIGVAVNNPQTVVYVVSVTSMAPSRNQLRETFVSDPPMASADAGDLERQELIADWRKKLYEEAGVKWLVEPTEFSMSDSGF